MIGAFTTVIAARSWSSSSHDVLLISSSTVDSVPVPFVVSGVLSLSFPSSSDISDRLRIGHVADPLTVKLMLISCDKPDDIVNGAINVAVPLLLSNQAASAKLSPAGI